MPGDKLPQKRKLLWNPLKVISPLSSSFLNNGHIYLRRPFLALLDVKGYPVALTERFEPRFVDAGMMNEYILAIFLGDEAISLLIAEFITICTA